MILIRAAPRTQKSGKPWHGGVNYSLSPGQGQKETPIRLGVRERLSHPASRSTVQATLSRHARTHANPSPRPVKTAHVLAAAVARKPALSRTPPAARSGTSVLGALERQESTLQPFFLPCFVVLVPLLVAAERLLPTRPVLSPSRCSRLFPLPRLFSLLCLHRTTHGRND